MTIGDIIEVLEEEGFDNVDYDYSSDNHHYFDAYTDSFTRVRVEVYKKYMDIYTQRAGEKHFTKEDTIPFT